MHQDDPNVRTSTPREPHIAHDVVLELVRSQIRNTIAPIGLEIDCAHLVQWAKHYQQNKFRCQHLTQELKTWGPHLSKRPVNLINLHNPFSLMDAPGITELMFAVGHNLKLIQGHHVEHAVTLLPENICRENVALLKGLGFNHVYIYAPHTLGLAKLKQLYGQVREFKLALVSVITEMAPDDTNPLARLMDVLSYIQPETLELKASPDHIFKMPVQSVTAILMQMGYYLHNNHSLIRFHSPLHTRPADMLRLGPGAISNIGALQTTNFTEPNSYYEQIGKARLPVASVR